MRIVYYLWIFNVCFDDERPWTIVFSLLFPLAHYVLVMEVVYNLLHRRISHFNITLSSFLIGFIIICIQGSNFEPYEETCTTRKVIPSAMIATATSSTFIYWLRYFTHKKDIMFSVLWTIALITRLISMPILKYFEWTVAVCSLIPGILFGPAFFLFEMKYSHLLYPLYSIFDLKNDFKKIKIHADIARKNDSSAATE